MKWPGGWWVMLPMVFGVPRATVMLLRNGETPNPEPRHMEIREDPTP